MYPVTQTVFQPASWFRGLCHLAMLVVVASLVGCGGTKVYTADKTIVYRDIVYNVSNVRIFAPKSEAVLADGATVNLKDMDREGFEQLLADNNSPVFVRQSFMLDSDEMVYQATTVTGWKDFNSMNKRFSKALKKLTKFLADKKKTQLKL